MPTSSKPRTTYLGEEELYDLRLLLQGLSSTVTDFNGGLSVTRVEVTDSAGNTFVVEQSEESDQVFVLRGIELVY